MNMTPPSSPEKIWALYDKLPKELQEYIFSEEFENKITDVCIKNKIEDDVAIVSISQNVLLGILPPEKFQEEVIGILKLDADIAKKITDEINKIIFAPLGGSLDELYNYAKGKNKIKNDSSINDTYREQIK